MRLTFASFAALSLSATQATKLMKHLTPTPVDQQLPQTQKPMSYSNIMDSVKSLEKAYEYHKNEEKLLNEINSELKEYWSQADISHKYVQDDHTDLVQAKTKVKADEKAKTAEVPKAAAAPVPAAENSQVTQAKPAVSDPDMMENIQLDDMNFLQVDEQGVNTPSEETLKLQNLEKILEEDPTLFLKELQQVKDHQQAKHTSQNKQKKYVDNHGLTQAQMEEASQEAEAEWQKEMMAAQELQEAKERMKAKERQLIRMKERQSAMAKAEANEIAQIEAEHQAQVAFQSALKQKQQQKHKQMTEERSDTAMDIKMKMKAAEEAIEKAERLSQEAKEEALELSSEHTAHHQSKHHKQEPAGLKFIQIPKYAFTTELDAQVQEDADKPWWEEAADNAKKWVSHASEQVHNWASHVEEEDDVYDDEQ